jgi:regulator of sigma E protease
MSTFLLGAVAFVAMILVVVGVHEGGHFATAKWFGIRVDEFAIGFGPRILSRRRGETVYSVRALPLGGFVKMPGMSALEEDTGGDRGFMRAPAWRKLVVLLAGVTMNFVLAGLLFGVTTIPGSAASSPPYGGAYVAGMRDGDVIVAVAGAPVPNDDPTAVANVLHDATAKSQGLPIQLTYRRATDGALITTTAKPVLLVTDANADHPIAGADGKQYGTMIVDTVDGRPLGTGDPAAVLGAGRSVHLTGHSLVGDTTSTPVPLTLDASAVIDGTADIGQIAAAWRFGYSPGKASTPVPSAVWQGFTSIPTRIADNVRSIYDVFATPGSGGVKNFSGPVGIARESAVSAQAGWIGYLEFVALISLSLGIINVLPIPPFDGGRVAIVLLETVRRRATPARFEIALITAGALLIGTLFIVITLNDIKGF